MGNLSLAEATGPGSYPVRRLIREHGEAAAQAWITLVLEEADAMIGSRNPAGTITMWGRLLLQQWSHRSVESIVMAIRDGMTAKVYGALTYPQISEWMQAHEAKVLGLSEDEAARHRFTGDNLGADYLDRLERGDEKSVLRRQVAELKRKLSTE